MASKEEQSRIGKSNVARSKAHERRVAKLLFDWSGVGFRRRRIEGRDTLTIELDSTSDVIAVDKDKVCKFSIEAKCGKKFSMDAMLASPATSIFGGWWHQTCYDAKLLSDLRGKPFYPMLFFKPAPAFDWVAFSKDAEESLLFHESPNTFVFDAFDRIGPVAGDVSHSKKHPKIISLKLDSAIICRWKDFARCVDPLSIFY